MDSITEMYVVTPCHSFMGRGVVNFPVERVVQLFTEDIEQLHRWEKYLVVSIFCMLAIYEDFHWRGTILL